MQHRRFSGEMQDSRPRLSMGRRGRLPYTFIPKASHLSG